MMALTSSTQIRGPRGTQAILLADSNVLSRNFLSRKLSREGYFVLAASNHQEALQLSQSFESKIHLLLSPSELAGGAAMIEQIVRDRPDIAVLVISAATHADLIQRSREQVANVGSLPEVIERKIRQALTDPASPGSSDEV
jgi:two-component system, cell cycle sensor histidine kinase and response regulator CckA